MHTLNLVFGILGVLVGSILIAAGLFGRFSRDYQDLDSQGKHRVQTTLASGLFCLIFSLPLLFI